MSLLTRFYSSLLRRAVVAATVLGLANVALGQSDAANPADQTKTITLQQKVEPSFRIEPVVQRFKSTRGQVVPFEFLMTSTGREMEVELKVVELRQEENGTILHNEDVPPAAGVTFSSPQTFTLAAGEARKITGEITVPAAKSNFHSFGILVRDQGLLPSFDHSKDPKNKASIQAGVKFITQYILRCDIEVEGVGENDLSKVRLENGGFRVKDGMPVARVWAVNPTNSAFEFQVRGVLKSETTQSRLQTFPLGMASRVELPEPDKYLIRMMPNSRLRLETPVSAALVPGPFQLTFSVNNGRREVHSETFAQEVTAGDFPALDVASIRVNEAVVAAPGQILLSQTKGGHRTASVKLTNSADDPQELKLQLQDLDGNVLSNVQISPETVQLAGKRSQNVRVTMRSQKDSKEPQFGYLQIATVATSDSDSVSEAAHASASARVPLAMYYGAPQTPELEYSDLELDMVNGLPVFRMAVANHGAGFAPIQGELEIVNDAGQRFHLTAGFNRWIAPDESFALLFRPESQISPGSYQTTLTLHTFENQPPKVSTKDITLTAIPTTASTEMANADQTN
jgi:hypothetical protein